MNIDNIMQDCPSIMLGNMEIPCNPPRIGEGDVLLNGVPLSHAEAEEIRQHAGGFVERLPAAHIRAAKQGKVADGQMFDDTDPTHDHDGDGATFLGRIEKEREHAETQHGTAA